MSEIPASHYLSAFPNSGAHANGYPEGGMTLRDYFAASALQGFCSGGTRGDPIKSIADLSYMVADAMLIAREEKK